MTQAGHVSTAMIRKALQEDTDAVMPLYDIARARMRSSGNSSQWINGYPSRELIAADIEAGNFYVMERGGEIYGAFTFIVGDDPTYARIENGAWPNNLPYGTIHRLASSGKAGGVSRECFDFCLSLTGNVRADTHSDNIPMRKALEKYGFAYCGIIHVADGSPRLAFQLCRSSRAPGIK